MAGWDKELRRRAGRSGYGLSRRAVNAALLGTALAGAAPSRSAAPAESRPTVLALGDSLMAGFGLPPETAFVAQLEEALARQGLAVTVIDGGVSGDTTAGGRARLGWVLADRPDLVVLCLGANDGLRGIDPDSTAANLDAMVAEITGRGIPLLLSGMLAPPNLGREYGDRFNAIYPRLAARYPAVVLDPFFLDGVAAIPTLNQADGIHPNAEGVRRIVNRLAALAAPMLRLVGP